MNFENLITGLENRLNQSLPAAVAHEPLRAIPLGKGFPNFTHQLPPRPGAVLILIYPDEGLIKFPLIKRPDYLGTHGGQVSFPGGKAEAGEDAYQTALREANEEVGVLAEQTTILGSLSDFFVIPSNFKVSPVVGYSTMKPLFIPDAREVLRILEGSLEALVMDDAVLEKEITIAGNFQLRAPHFEIAGEVVWGATAMMLNEFRMVLRDVLAKNDFM